MPKIERVTVDRVSVPLQVQYPDGFIRVTPSAAEGMVQGGSLLLTPKAVRKMMAILDRMAGMENGGRRT